MNPTTPPQPVDNSPQGWRAELVHALAQPELAEVNTDTEPAQRAAYWLAVVLGNCRVREIDLGQKDGSLLPLVALAAGKRLASLLSQWSKEARSLGERLDRVTSGVEANDLCFDLLEARTEAWAAFIAVDEAYQACLVARSSLRAEFVKLVEQILDRTEELDKRMQDNLELFSVVAHYPLFDNMMHGFSKSHLLALPWWLDGRLQAAAQQVENDNNTWLPHVLVRSAIPYSDRFRCLKNPSPKLRHEAWRFRLTQKRMVIADKNAGQPQEQDQTSAGGVKSAH
jgi:hypothetical protein